MTGYVRRVFERWAVELKEPKLHPHTMRHTFGSELARLGVSVSTIAALMGHQLSSGGANVITHLLSRFTGRNSGPRWNSCGSRFLQRNHGGLSGLNPGFPRWLRWQPPL